ncbi:YidC/Oxa1 family membrane protein insertase [Candidatus Parcubacteria bacterium]|nr:YidC/Oxa1 family membrane protein insertase [Candidatus Parcubacteria bacterium]
MTWIYHVLIFNPLYNVLIFLLSVVPFSDAGIAVVIVTILVRLILFPISKKAVVTQVKMQSITPKLNEIKEKYKNNTEEQAKKTLELYREAGVNPFSSFFLLFIQLPIILALYRIFTHAGFPNVDIQILYPFVHAPAHISTQFLGLNLTEKSVILAVLASLATYFQIRLAGSQNTQSSGNDLAANMQKQMKYVFPVLVFLIAYKVSGVLALYWFTTNLFTIAQEIFVRRKLKTA